MSVSIWSQRVYGKRRMKKIALGLILPLVLTLASCAGQKKPNTPAPTFSPSPNPTCTPLWSGRFIPFTPKSTRTNTPPTSVIFPPEGTPVSISTAIAFNDKKQSLSQVVEAAYNAPVACKLDWLDPSHNPSPYDATPDPKDLPRKLDFVDITKQVDLKKVWIREVVESTDKVYRAYLVEEGLPEKCSACIRSAIYVENLLNKTMYRIDFEGYQPNRVLYGLFWIGDKVVTFAQNDSPYYDDIFSINVESKKFVYLASFPRCSN